MRATPGPSDDDLLRRLRGGEEAAFTTLFRRWQGPIYRFALRMSGRPAVAEDVAQETFMALIAGADRFDPERGSLSSYLYGIARHRVQRRLEKDGAYVPIDEETDDETSGRAASETAQDDPLAELVRRERIDRVRDAVLGLPAHYREAVVLCDLQLLSYQEAAEALGCAVGTVRSRLHRGRGLLVGKLRIVAEAEPVLGRAPSAG